jgi:hypothetical protein
MPNEKGTGAEARSPMSKRWCPNPHEWKLEMPPCDVLILAGDRDGGEPSLQRAGRGVDIHWDEDRQTLTVSVKVSTGT